MHWSSENAIRVVAASLAIAIAACGTCVAKRSGNPSAEPEAAKGPVPLEVRTVGRDDAPGPLTVFFHGYGAPGDDLVPLAEALSGVGYWVLPEAPIELEGLGGGRAFFRFRFSSAPSPSEARRFVPPELASVRSRVLATIAQATAQHPKRPLIVGGFSQGAIIAVDAALHMKEKPAGVAILSGALIAEEVWSPRASRLADVPVLSSHGRNDDLLPYEAGEALRDMLFAAGARVKRVDFDGGHGIPPPVVQALGSFISNPEGG